MPTTELSVDWHADEDSKCSSMINEDMLEYEVLRQYMGLRAWLK